MTVGQARFISPTKVESPAAGPHAKVYPGVPPVAEAVNQMQDPGQSATSPGSILAVGGVLIVTLTEVVPVQPFAFVTVTEYVVGTVGLTVTLAVVAPVLHKNEVPPAAVKVVDEPKQTVKSPVICAKGKGFTVTVACSASTQPAAFVTVTL